MNKNEDKILVWFVVCSIIAACFVMLISAARSEEHDHSLYELDCCSLDDCKPIKETEVEITTGGWIYKPTGHVFTYAARAIRHSRDKRFHVCITPTNIHRCLYVPDHGA